MPAAFRGACETCDGDYAVRKDGKIGKHPAAKPKFDRGDGKCKGSDKPFKIINLK